MPTLARPIFIWFLSGALALGHLPAWLHCQIAEGIEAGVADPDRAWCGCCHHSHLASFAKCSDRHNASDVNVFWDGNVLADHSADQCAACQSLTVSFDKTEMSPCPVWHELLIYSKSIYSSRLHSCEPFKGARSRAPPSMRMG